MTRIPHFDLPFRLVGSSYATVEQDSYLDIVNCVTAIVKTPVGFRDDLPAFGRPEILFMNQPIEVDVLQDSIVGQEPRADVLITEQRDAYDQLIDHLIMEVYPAS